MARGRTSCTQSHEQFINSHRVKCKMTQDPTCPRCGAAEETTLHTFRDCPKSMEVWRQYASPTQLRTWRRIPLQNWMELNLQSRSRIPACNLPWDTVFAIICWYIWIGRDQHIFQNNEDWLRNNRHLETANCRGNQDQCRWVSKRSPWKCRSRRSGSF